MDGPPEKESLEGPFIGAHNDSIQPLAPIHLLQDADKATSQTSNQSIQSPAEVTSQANVRHRVQVLMSGILGSEQRLPACFIVP